MTTREILEQCVCEKPYRMLSKIRIALSRSVAHAPRPVWDDTMRPYYDALACFQLALPNVTKVTPQQLVAVIDTLFDEVR